MIVVRYTCMKTLLTSPVGVPLQEESLGCELPICEQASWGTVCGRLPQCCWPPGREWTRRCFLSAPVRCGHVDMLHSVMPREWAGSRNCASFWAAVFCWRRSSDERGVVCAAAQVWKTWERRSEEARKRSCVEVWIRRDPQSQDRIKSWRRKSPSILVPFYWKRRWDSG